MGLLDRFKKWLKENEGEFKDSSDKATKFIEDLGREIGHTGSKVAKSAEEVIRKFDEELSKKGTEKTQSQPSEKSYSKEPQSSTQDEEYFDEEENSAPDEESIKQTEKDVSSVEKLMDNIDELINELKEQEEQDIPDPRDHKTAIDQDWKGMDDDFIKKATRFADRELSRSSESIRTKEDQTNDVKGFEDRDNDGDPIIDDAEIDESE